MKEAISEKIEERRERATELHLSMQSENAPLVARGRFYLALLQAKIWDSQSDLSASLNVSKGHVSKCIKAARLPDVVLKAFGDDRRVSFRTVDLIEQIGFQIGEVRMRENATMLGKRRDLSIRDVLGALASGSVPEDAVAVRLSIRRGEDHIRLYSPQIRRLSKMLPRLEEHINVALRLMSFKV